MAEDDTKTPNIKIANLPNVSDMSDIDMEELERVSGGRANSIIPSSSDPNGWQKRDWDDA